ncbi:MAG TPA: NUDIX domain-containing protein [Pseudonocardia sp.]|nr:NUDIX domain-containing protein [Pseudonocardia sp.]
MAWRDSSGRELADYPHPSLAVDVALLTLTGDMRLAVLLHEKRDGLWSLPGTFVRMTERLRDSALRALREKAGVTGHEPEQLRVFDELDRDDRGRVISVAHVDLVPLRELGPTSATLVPVASLPELAFDHDDIVAAAVAWARAEYRERPDPRRLVGEEFTLLELQRVHEAVLGVPLQKDTFRRRMIDRLDDTGRLSRGGVGKPARVFRRAPDE